MWTRRSAAGTSFRPPRPPLVWGVRRQEVITMSEGCFWRRGVRAAGDVGFGGGEVRLELVEAVGC